MRILVENIPNDLSAPEKLVEMITAAHFSDVGVCFDVGHAHMSGNIPEAFETLKQHIRSTHIHDNKADRDSHLWPGEGSIDWKEFMDLLRTAPHVPPVLLEIEGEEHLNPADKMQKAFRKLDES